jgi:hypothetical protein
VPEAEPSSAAVLLLCRPERRLCPRLSLQQGWGEGALAMHKSR